MGEFKVAQHPTQTVVICAFKRANDLPEATPPVQAVQFSRSAAEARAKRCEVWGRSGKEVCRRLKTRGILGGLRPILPYPAGNTVSKRR